MFRIHRLLQCCCRAALAPLAVASAHAATLADCPFLGSGDAVTRGFYVLNFQGATIEEMEEELLDAATAAQTVEELNAELIELAELIETAKKVREAGTDRKWAELSTILQDNALTTDRNGWPRKIIIFTEHRDTLNYLQSKIGSLIGKPDSVKAIHGGVRRGERRLITEEFTKNHDVQILLATDAAGEGLNLQAAHLMVNYDLPWNPQRAAVGFPL